MFNKRKNILIKSISLLILIVLLFIINCESSFAKILTINLDELEFYIPDNVTQEVEDGVYIISCAGNSNFVFDIYNNSLVKDGNLIIWTRNGGANQKFYISYEGDGYYKISSINSALVLDVESGSKENGTNIRQWEDNSSNAQRWKINKNSDGTYTFVAQCSGKALDVDGAIFENGRNVQQYDSNNTNAQKFNLEKTDIINEGIVSIRKVDSVDMVVDVKDNSSKDGEKIQLYGKNGSLAQRFEIYKIKNDEVRIRTMSSGGWLTEEGKEAGSSVIQEGDSSTPVSDANTWKVEWNNGIVFKNKESGLYLDVEGNKTDNATKIKVNKKNNNQISQRFLVVKEDLLGGWYEIESALGTFVDLDNSGSDWGTNIHMWERNGQNNQKFKFTKSGDGYLITTMYGLAFDVENGSMENFANVRQWEDNNSDCQRWIPEIRDGGYVAFKNLNSGKYMDIENESSEKGANIYAYDPVGEENFKRKYPTEITYVKAPEEAIKDANVCFIFTEWNEIKNVKPEEYKKLMKTPLVYDGRNIYNINEMIREGVEYYSIGR